MRISIFMLVVIIPMFIFFIFLFYLIVKALLKYIRTKEVRDEKKEVKKSLGETLRTHRIRMKMTQEFVAESIGVSRQAVSKWENGTSDPSTSNLIALAELFEMNAADLLKEVNN